MSRALLASGLLVATAAAWYWALQPRAPQGRGVQARPHAATARQAVPAVGLDRLDGRVQPPLPSDSARNPFRSASRRPGATEPSAPPREPAPPSVPPTPAVTWPRLALIGIAEGKDGAAMARTAIISGPRGVHHVRVGDQLEDVYRVEGILETAVDLRLVPEDRVLRLALRP